MTQALTPPTDLHCANCGTPLYGEFCHICGQSIHSVLKPVHGMLDDTMDLVLNIDGRVVQTLPPLFMRPGFLTLEYFAGRRVRYLAPFRLMFALCLLAFFVCQLRIENSSIDLGPNLHVNTTKDEAFESATTPAAVKLALQQQSAELQQARSNLGLVGKLAAPSLAVAEKNMHKQAAQRLQALAAAPMSEVSTIPTASATASIDDDPENRDSSGDEDWLTRPSPSNINWLPGFVNSRLSVGVDRLKANIRAMKSPGASRQETTGRILANFFGVLPQTMFVMVPLFALLLKLFYVFRRRLYTEHLIVVLHSHAYLFLSLLLSVSLGALSSWLAPHAAWVTRPLGWLEWGLALWVPVYLLIMQKRIYRQGWPMTLLKFWCIGWCYFWLLLLALTVAAALGMAG